MIVAVVHVTKAKVASFDAPYGKLRGTDGAVAEKRLDSPTVLRGREE
jgi:hypothetical protein